jgi:hypothetical protein
VGSGRDTHNASAAQHSIVGEAINNVEVECVALK